MKKDLIEQYSVATEKLRELNKTLVNFHWFKEHQNAFNNLKLKLTYESTVAYYKSGAETELVVDGAKNWCFYKFC